MMIIPDDAGDTFLFVLLQISNGIIDIMCPAGMSCPKGQHVPYNMTDCDTKYSFLLFITYSSTISYTLVSFNWFNTNRLLDSLVV